MLPWKKEKDPAWPSWLPIYFKQTKTELKAPVQAAQEVFEFNVTGKSFWLESDSVRL